MKNIVPSENTSIAIYTILSKTKGQTDTQHKGFISEYRRVSLQKHVQSKKFQKIRRTFTPYPYRYLFKDNKNPGINKEYKIFNPNDKKHVMPISHKGSAFLMPIPDLMSIQPAIQPKAFLLTQTIFLHGLLHNTLPPRLHFCYSHISCIKPGTQYYNGYIRIERTPMLPIKVVYGILVMVISLYITPFRYRSRVRCGKYS